MNNLLKSQKSISIIAFVAITVLAAKNGPVFKELSFPDGSSSSVIEFFQYAISFISVIAIELAVLIFVYRGEKKESIAFAVFSFLCSLFYFNEFNLNFNDWNINIMQIAISAIFPFIVVRFSHIYKEESSSIKEIEIEITKLKLALEEEQKLNSILKLDLEKQKLEREKTEKEKDSLKLDLQEEQRLKDSLKLDLESYKLDLQEEKKLIASLKLEKQELEKKYFCSCGAGPFLTPQALAGHKRKCPHIKKEKEERKPKTIFPPKKNFKPLEIDSPF